MNYKIDISNALDALNTKIKRMPEILESASEAVRLSIVLHIDRRADKGNKKGFPSTGFWKMIDGNTRVESSSEYIDDPVVDGNIATITIDHLGIRRAKEDVRIEPKNAKYLTIPLNALSYGKSVRQYQQAT